MADGAPLGHVATVGHRARTPDRPSEFAVTCMSSPAVVVRFDGTADWAPWQSSSMQARSVAEAVREAISSLPGGTPAATSPEH